MEWVYCNDGRYVVTLFGAVVGQHWDGAEWQTFGIMPLEWHQEARDLFDAVSLVLDCECKSAIAAINELEHRHYRDIENWTEAGR
jgi:hypothetical protein